jgi:hypothetical protein
MLGLILNIILSILGKSVEEKREWYGSKEEKTKSTDSIDENIEKTKVMYKGKMNCSCGCTPGKSELESSFMKMIGFLGTHYNSIVTVDSGYRCPEYNSSKRVKGAKNSMHIKWPIQAADIRIEGVSAKEVYKLLDHKFPISGLGYYLNTKKGREFIHIDSRDYTARWLRIDGKYLKATNKNLKKYGLI